MSGRLAATIALYALFCAAVLGVGSLAGRERGPLELASLGALELALLAQAAVALVAIAGGQRAGEPATFGGYLAASVAILPLAAGFARDRASRWEGGALAATCVALAVVSWRLDATWAA